MRSGIIKTFRGVTILSLAVLLASCASGGGSGEYQSRHGVTTPAHNDLMKNVTTVAVLPFREAIPAEVAVGRRNICPVTGLQFGQGTVMEGSGELVADQFRAALAARGYHIAGRDRVNEALKKKGGDYSVATALAVADDLGVEVVFIGYVMRFEERVGSGLAVKSPASVAFSLGVVHRTTRNLDIKAKFDKTQRSLFEDLTDIGTFVKGGMKWQRAATFSATGVESILDELKR